MIWPFRKAQPLPARRRLNGPTVQALVTRALQGKTLPNFRLFMQKSLLACPPKPMLRKAADLAFKDWQGDLWECEDQARALVHHAQLIAAKEGCSWAVGTLRANAPEGTPGALHVFVWAILDLPEGLQFTLFDPTANEWADVPDLSGVDYALT
jgi:hypothetical protein